jgi:dUTP pyrophosphatase
METVEVKVEKINNLAVLPKYAHEGDAGFDLYSTDCGSLKPGETKVFGTGLKMEIPKGYAVAIRPRSGMSLKTSLRITNAPGTIDSIYRGEVGIILQNTGKKTLHIDIGDRIAQGVLEKIPTASFIAVDDLSETERGEGGFGSTGKQ